MFPGIDAEGAIKPKTSVITMRTCIWVAVRNQKSDGLANSNKSGVSMQRKHSGWTTAALARLKAACHTDGGQSAGAYRGWISVIRTLKGLGLENFGPDGLPLRGSERAGRRKGPYAGVFDVCRFDGRA